MNTSPNNTETLTVIGMTCSHCVAAVTSELSKLDDVTRVDVDLTTGSVTIESDQPVDPAAMTAAVQSAGYELDQAKHSESEDQISTRAN
jgi:copper chaperone